MSSLKEQMAYVTVLSQKITQTTHSAILKEQDTNALEYSAPSGQRPHNLYVEESAEECASYCSKDEYSSSDSSEVYGVNPSSSPYNISSPVSLVSSEVHGLTCNQSTSTTESSPQPHRRDLRAHAKECIQLSPVVSDLTQPVRNIILSDSEHSSPVQVHQSIICIILQLNSIEQIPTRKRKRSPFVEEFPAVPIDLKPASPAGQSTSDAESFPDDISYGFHEFLTHEYE